MVAWCLGLCPHPCGALYVCLAGPFRVRVTAETGEEVTSEPVAVEPGSARSQTSPKKSTGACRNLMSECPSVHHGILWLSTPPRPSQEATEDELAAQQALGDQFAPWSPLHKTLTLLVQKHSMALRLWKTACT